MIRRRGTAASLLAAVLALAIPTRALAAGGRSEAGERPLAVTPTMRAWLDAAPRASQSDLDRLRGLLGRLLAPGDDRIHEDPSSTPTAAEAFARRRADCVGFALLFVALARTDGVDARFALSPAIERTDQAGNLRIQRTHVAATFDGRIFDFGGEQPFDTGGHREVSDRTAIALYFSNRGAQSLAAQRATDAVELLYRALRFDPSLSWVWTNLGVALRRTGDPTGAILAYEMALRLDAADGAARRNLALARSSAD